MKEAELVAAARVGDENAFQQLRRLHLTHVRTACWAILRTDDLDDVIQDTFLNAWKGLQAFRGESTFRTWVTSIARRCSFRVLDECKKSGALFAELPDEGHSSMGEERSVARMESCVDLARLMSGLPPRNRQLMEMNREGLSDREIAEATSLSLRAVRGRMQRGRDKMRERFFGAPEQNASARSLISEKAAHRGGGTTTMATPDKRKRRHLKTRAPEAADSSAESMGQAEATGIPTDVTEPGEDATAPFSFDKLVTEVEQLEYLAAIEARRQFDAEIVREALIRVESLIRNLLVGREFDASHEKAIVNRMVELIKANEVMRTDLARLQQIRMGVHSREIRLWYIEAVAQQLLPEALNDVLQEGAIAAPASGEVHTA